MRLSITIPEQVYLDLKAKAVDETRSLASMILHLLKRGLEEK